MFEQTTATFDRRHRSFFSDSDDGRQVWALDTARRQIVHLPDGAVDDDVRTACQHGRLRCPVTDCPDPRLVAKGGTLRRHHFAHKVAHTPHDAATILRAEAAALLAAWARRYRGAEVTTSATDELDIVRVRSAFSGRRVELAITYEPRFDDLDSFDRPSRQLLVGHTRALLLPRMAHPSIAGAWWCGAARLISEISARHGAAVAINPQLRLAATLIATTDATRANLAPRDTAHHHPTICFVSDLATCQLEQSGLTTPHLAALRAWQQRHPEEPTNRRRTRRQTPHRPGPDARPGRPTHESRHSDAAHQQSQRDTRRSRAHDSAVQLNRVVLVATVAEPPERRTDPRGNVAWRLRVSCEAAGARPRSKDRQELVVTAHHAAHENPSELTPGTRIAIDGQLDAIPSAATGASPQQLEILAEHIVLAV